MMQLKDVRDYIATLSIAEDGRCYCGILADKQDKSIGAYPLKRERAAVVPLGGMDNSSCRIHGISILVHWNKSVTETEKAANDLQEQIQSCRNVTVNGQTILFIQPSYDEPIPVGTDENGIFEYVIECLIYVKK